MRRVGWRSFALLLTGTLGWLGADAAPVARPHAPVQLKDADGRAIHPGAADPAPYSPRQTCGGCHDYAKITQGYHFQMGADEAKPNVDKPWVWSPGQIGKQFHMSYEWIAAKSNRTEAEVGVSAWEFGTRCGGCHPGGGAFETDRGGQRFDRRQKAQPALAKSLDGDYHQARWDQSGVVEADCLICHLPGYSMPARNAQLARANYGWAATVGSGLGQVNGSVLAGEKPKLTYGSASGKVSLNIVRSPADAACLSCHAEAEAKKRGHVWDGRTADVHTAAGLRCVSCHASGADHQFAKGQTSEVSVRNDLDSDTVSCQGCHSKRLGVPRPKHPDLPAGHLDKIACVTCHVRGGQVAAVGTVDTTTGATMGLPTSPQARKYGESAPWQPSYFRLADGKLYSGNALLPAWWGSRAGATVHPLTLAETKRAFELAKAEIRDDNGDDKPEANTAAEITAMLRAITRSQEGGRFAAVDPVFVKGWREFELVGDQLRVRMSDQAQPLRWTFSHNVAPARQAWGAGGCGDCHGDASPFFEAPIVLDPFGTDGKPITAPMWSWLRYSRRVVTMATTGPTAAEQALVAAKAARQPVLLSFRSASCIPCRAMDRIVTELRPKYAGRIAFVDVSLDEDSPDEALIARYDIRIKPTTFVVNGIGAVVETKIGVWPAEQLAARLDALLGGK
ncbi:MAG: hypothetical protein HZB16_20410 [Armatimonadetes bacterium]|nr:hypothetical protein [Armatimonadota bacterium]